MPFQSQAQWRWAFANNKPWAKKWAKNTPRKLTDLPDRSAKAATTGNFSATAGEKIGGNQCRDANGHFVNCDDLNAVGPVQQDGYRPPTAQEAGSSMAAYEAATEEAKLIESERKKRARAEMKKRLYGEPAKGGAISPAERKRQARAEQKKNESNTHGQVGPGDALGAALSNFADPDNPGMLPNLTAMRLEELGLVEFSSRTGKPYITGEGRAYINAARSGDMFAAREAMQRAQDTGFEKREAAIQQQEMMLQQAEQEAFQQQIDMIQGTPQDLALERAYQKRERRERAAKPKPSKAPRESNRTYGSGKVTVGSPKSTVKEMKTEMNIEIPKEIFTTMLIGQSYADKHAYNHPASRYVMKAINNEKLTMKDVRDIHAWHQSLKEVDGDSDKPTAEWIVYQLLGAQSGFYWVDSVMSSYEMAMSAYKSESPKINRVPSQSASTNAIRGLDIQHAFSRGGSGSMIALGRKIANRKELTDDDIRTMHSYLQRHTGDRKDGWADISDPSVAYINWMIHGGDEGLSWASEKVDMLRLKREKPSREQYKSRRDQMMGKRPGQGSAATGDYALPAEKRFPITDYGSVTAALNEWTQYRGLSKYEDFKKGLIAVAVRKGLTSALPKSWRKEIPEMAEKERLKHRPGGRNHDQSSHGNGRRGTGRSRTFNKRRDTLRKQRAGIASDAASNSVQRVTEAANKNNSINQNKKKLSTPDDMFPNWKLPKRDDSSSMPSTPKPSRSPGMDDRASVFNDPKKDWESVRMSRASALRSAATKAEIARAGGLEAYIEDERRRFRSDPFKLARFENVDLPILRELYGKGPKSGKYDDPSDGDSPSPVPVGSGGPKSPVTSESAKKSLTLKAHQGGKDSFSPPAGVRSAAKRGLELRSKFGRGGTSVGIARGRDLSNGKSVSASTIRRMNSFFARHAVDKRPDWSNPSKPSNGYIAHLLWGGDAGRAWASKVSRHLDAKKKEYPSYVFNSNIDIYRHRNDEALKKEQQRHKVEYSIKSRRQRAASTFDSRQKATLKGKNKPSNPSLWSKAVAEAKKKYTVYPSAYANGYAAKWYKKNGGTWKTEKDLRDWFAEDWVDISRPKKGGGYEPCGRKTDDMSESDYRKKYPKCVPASRAARMSESEKRSAIERKREDGLPKGGKPSMVSTGKSTIMPSNDDYTNALQVRRKKPSNGAAGVLSTIVNM